MTFTFWLVAQDELAKVLPANRVSLVVVAANRPMLLRLAAADRKESDDANVAVNWAVVLETLPKVTALR